MKKYLFIGAYLSILLSSINVYAQKTRPKPRAVAPSIKGWWRSMIDPRFTMKFDDTLTYWYYDYKDPSAIRYWLVNNCESTKSVPYGKAEYIVTKDPDFKYPNCAWFIAYDNQYLGWIDNSTGHRQSFERIKAPKAVSH